MNVRWHPQYRGSEIIGYTVYGWKGHVLLGEILGTRTFTETEKEAKRIAHEMRKWN